MGVVDDTMPNAVDAKCMRSFLASVPTRGPREARRDDSEFASHEAADLDVKFLMALARHDHPVGRSMCVPSFYACMRPRRKRAVAFVSARNDAALDAFPSHMRLRASLVVTHLYDAPKMWLPSARLRAAVASGARFTVCSLGLYDDDTFAVGHANAIVFDADTKVAERYEPDGARHAAAVDACVREALRDALPEWRYAATTATAPHRGPQSRVDDFAGMCVTYSLLYVLLRLCHPAADAEAVQATVTRMSTRALRTVALRLNRRIADVLRAHPRGTLVRRAFNARDAAQGNEFAVAMRAVLAFVTQTWHAGSTRACALSRSLF